MKPVCPKLLGLLACALLSAILPGCGSLQVQVDVVNPEYVHDQIADGAMRQLYRAILQARPGALAAATDHRFNAYRERVLAFADTYEALAEGFDSPAKDALIKSATDLRADLADGGKIATRSHQTGSTLETLAQDLRQYAATHAWNGYGAVPPEIRTRLQTIQAEDNADATQQLNDLRALIVTANQLALESTLAHRGLTRDTLTAAQAPAAQAAAKDAERMTASLNAQGAAAQAEASRSIVGGNGLSNTEFAYIVAHAPPDAWEQRFNEVVGSGFMGNLDVVIRMNGTADFSVKGLRFDASTVATVASKVVTQSVLLGAQMAGVPIPTASSGGATGGEALSGASASLATVQQSLATREAVTSAQRQAIRVLASGILATLPPLTTGPLKGASDKDPARDTLHKSINTTFQALKPQLELTELH